MVFQKTSNAYTIVLFRLDSCTYYTYPTNIIKIIVIN